MGVEHTLQASDRLESRPARPDRRPPARRGDRRHRQQRLDVERLRARSPTAGRLVFVGITTDEVKFRHPVFHKPEGTLLCSRNALSDDFTRIIEPDRGGPDRHRARGSRTARRSTS